MFGFVSKEYALKSLGESAIININPVFLEKYYYYNGRKLKKLMRSILGKKFGEGIYYSIDFNRKNFTPSGKWDLKSKLFENQQAYKIMRDIWENRRDYKKSKYYDAMLSMLEENGYARHKKRVLYSKADIDGLFTKHFLGLIFTMEKDGYNQSFATDYPGVAIARDGSLLKAGKGRHRVSVAQLVGVKSIPVEVRLIHPEFVRRARGGFSGHRLLNLKVAIGEVEKKYSSGP